MIPDPSCTRCALAACCKQKVESIGSVPADLLFLADPPSRVEETVGHVMPAVEIEMLQSILEESFERAGRVRSYHYAPIIFCPPKTESGVHRPARPAEILACFNNIATLTKQIRPKLVILVGDIAQKFYAKEFPEAFKMLPVRFIQSHPGLWATVVQRFAVKLKELE